MAPLYTADQGTDFTMDRSGLVGNYKHDSDFSIPYSGVDDLFPDWYQRVVDDFATNGILAYRKEAEAFKSILLETITQTTRDLDITMSESSVLRVPLNYRETEAECFGEGRWPYYFSTPMVQISEKFSGQRDFYILLYIPSRGYFKVGGWLSDKPNNVRDEKENIEYSIEKLVKIIDPVLEETIIPGNADKEGIMIVDVNRLTPEKFEEEIKVISKILNS